MVNLEIAYSDKQVTPFGGMVWLKRFIDKTGIIEKLSGLNLPEPGSNRGYDSETIVQSFRLSIWTGASRYIHCDWLRYDTVLQKIFGQDQMPSQSTYSRFFKKFSQARNTRVFPPLQRDFVNFHCIPYQLQFKFPFRIAHGMRTHTAVVYVRLQAKGFTAWGEAALPPYLPETQASVISFVTDFVKHVGEADTEDCLTALQHFGTRNMAARAAVDMALWNLKAQQAGKTIAQLLGIATANTYTIGICALNEMKLKVEDALQNGFQLFKIKLDGKADEEMISNFGKLSALPFAVDVNQGWNYVKEAAAKIDWLKQQGCILVAQPLPKLSNENMKKLKLNSSLPLYADESCQTVSDLEGLKEGFHGIYIYIYIYN